MSQIQDKLIKQNKLHFEGLLQNHNKHVANKSCSESNNTSRLCQSSQIYQRDIKENQKITADCQSLSNNASQHIRNRSEISNKERTKTARNNCSSQSDHSKSRSRENTSYNDIYERQKQWSEIVKKKKETALNEK